jgi:hypothetical protein
MSIIKTLKQRPAKGSSLGIDMDAVGQFQTQQTRSEFANGSTHVSGQD